MVLSEARPPEALPDLSGSALEIHGLDLSHDDHRQGATWPRAGTGLIEADPDDGRFSVEGFTSPMGFRFFYTPNTLEVPPHALTVTVHTRWDASDLAWAVRRRRRTGPVRTISVACPDTEDGELTVVIGASGADVFARDSAWVSL